MNAISRINNKRFGKLIFQLFDKENKGEITFEEFLVTAFGALSLDDSSLTRFSFRLFDLDNSGQLSPNEIENLIHRVKHTFKWK
jgi:Ca2+-binding EF-hand superfamily protein